MTIVLVCKNHISLTSRHTLEKHPNTHPRRRRKNQNVTRLYVPSCHFGLVNIVCTKAKEHVLSKRGVLCVHQLGLPPIIQTKPLQDYLFTRFFGGGFQIKNVYNARYTHFPLITHVHGSIRFKNNQNNFHVFLFFFRV